MVPVREFSVSEPSIPRVWDVLLGGKDNFAADREQAEKVLVVFRGQRNWPGKAANSSAARSLS